jgi:hypothetical protein
VDTPRGRLPVRTWLRVDQCAFLDQQVFLQKGLAAASGDSMQVNRGSIIRDLIDKAMDQEDQDGRDLS